MNGYFPAAAIAALALTLSGGATTATPNNTNRLATIAAPAAGSTQPLSPDAAPSHGQSEATKPGAAPATPGRTDQAKPEASEQARPALSAADAAVAASLRGLIEKKLRQYVSREQDRAGVEAFYRKRDFAPLWSGGAAPLPRAKEAIAFLRGVGADGLEPADYPTPPFSGPKPDALAADELKLTNSLLTFARHASTGRVAFTRVSGSVYYDLKFPDAAAVLEKLATASDIRAALDSYNPRHPAYKALKAELAAARRRAESGAEELVKIPAGPILRPGMVDTRMPMLRQRLKVADTDNLLYDDTAVAAVKAFQEKSSLNPDGMVGPNTLARLNGESRIDPTDTIIANMERWRWLPHDLGADYVMVNVPDYTLKVVDDGNKAWSTRIVVGKPGRYSTPLLTETMKFITVNPTWNVPPSIIRNEYLPALQQDPNALARIGLRIGRNADGSLRVFQPPGERNALGRIRFNFPNRFLVYQHDTPDKNLFEKSARAYSHGCMRVQNPDRYAEVLLNVSQPEERYSAERIRSLYGTGERTINFKNPIPVYVTYQTAFVDESGQLQTRADIYGMDKEITSILDGNRQVADVPVARNYSSGSSPVMADVSLGRPDEFGYQPYRDAEYPDRWREAYPSRDRFRPW